MIHFFWWPHTYFCEWSLSFTASRKPFLVTPRKMWFPQLDLKAPDWGQKRNNTLFSSNQSAPQCFPLRGPALYPQRAWWAVREEGSVVRLPSFCFSCHCNPRTKIRCCFQQSTAAMHTVLRHVLVEHCFWDTLLVDSLVWREWRPRALTWNAWRILWACVSRVNAAQEQHAWLLFSKLGWETHY